jgi:hypothetical protein
MDTRKKDQDGMVVGMMMRKMIWTITIMKRTMMVEMMMAIQIRVAVIIAIIMKETP